MIDSLYLLSDRLSDSLIYFVQPKVKVMIVSGVNVLIHHLDFQKSGQYFSESLSVYLRKFVFFLDKSFFTI